MRPEHEDAPGAATRELRLALGIRGGVSLAVWIGGACAEIDELRRDEQPFWRELREACGYTGVCVDVLAGASAGGLNGVLFASAIRHGFPMRDLMPVWVRVASVNRLRRTAPPWLSLFDGDGAFLDRVHEILRTEVGRAVYTGTTAPSAAFVDLQLAATLVEPIATPATSPSDERLGRPRSSARFHFRSAAGVTSRDDFAGDASLARLAVAARATSSFPGAFEAAVVRSTRPAVFGVEDVRVPPTHRLVDCRGVFSESRGAASAAESITADDFVLADGGIVDNIPLGRALEAVATAPASGPTRRVLVYLHPNGPAPPPATSTADEVVANAEPPAAPDAGAVAVSRRNVVAVAKGTIAAKLQEESIDGDLDQLERHNRAVRIAQTLRGQTCNRLGDITAVTDQHWNGYVVQRPAADAARLRRLLDDPLAVLGEDPFPVVVDEAQWRAPLAGWENDHRVRLDEELVTAFAAQLDAVGQGGLFCVGLGALRRGVDMALEWVRAVTPSHATATAKPALYQLRSIVGVLERARRLGWVAVAALRPPDDVTAWCASALPALDRLVCVPDRVATSLLAGDRSTYDALTNKALQEIVRGEAEGEAVLRLGGGVDLRTRIIECAVEYVEAVFKTAPQPLNARHPAALLDRVLRTFDGSRLEHLAALEILCLPEHLAGAPHGDEITFFRMSAAAETPVAPRFECLEYASQQLDAVRRDGWTTNGTFLRPEVKLAGNELSNFAAFFDRRWRQNDWMWGRLDSASTLVEILLTTATKATGGVPDAACTLAGLPPGSPLGDVRTSLIGLRQEQILEELQASAEFETRLDPATWSVGLETLREPGSDDIQRSAGDLVAASANVIYGTLPAALRWVAGPVGRLGRGVVWWLTRPTGRLPAALTAVPRSAAPPSSVDSTSAAARFGLGVALPLLLGGLLAALAWGAVASTTSLVVGLLAGLLVGLAIVGLLVAVAWSRPSRVATRTVADSPLECGDVPAGPSGSAERPPRQRSRRW